MDISIVGQVGFYILMIAIIATICFMVYLLIRLSVMGKSIKVYNTELTSINKSVAHINKQTELLKKKAEAKKTKKSQVSSVVLALAFLKYFQNSEEKGLNRVKDSVIKTISNELPKQLNKPNKMKTNLIR